MPQARSSQDGFGVDFNIFWQGCTLPLTTGLLLSAGGPGALFFSVSASLKASEFATPLWQLMQEAETQERKTQAPES